MSENKIENLISDITNDIESFSFKDLVRFIVVGTEQEHVKSKFVSELIERLNTKKQKNYYFLLPESDSEFYKTHRTFIPAILEHIIYEDKESNGLTPLLGNNPENSGKMTIDWDEEDNSESEKLNETNIEVENVNNDDKSNDLDTNAFADAIQSMVGMLSSQLGNIFSGIQDKLKSIDSQLSEIEKDIEDPSYEIEKGTKSKDQKSEKNDVDYELNEITKSLNEIKNNMSNSLNNPLDLFKNLQSFASQEKDNLQYNRLQNIESENYNSNKKAINYNNKINSRPESLILEDIRNNIQSNSNKKDFLSYLNELTELLISIASQKKRIILILDRLDNADEGFFMILEQILMKQKVSLTIIGTYIINYSRKDAIRGISNKNLRLLLTNFKLDKIGREIILN